MAHYLFSASFTALKVTCSGAKTKGDMHQEGSGVIGQWFADYADGDEGILITEAKDIQVPKAAGVAFAVGAKVYYDVADTNFNADTANPFGGHCKVAAVSAATNMRICFYQGKD